MNSASTHLGAGRALQAHQLGRILFQASAASQRSGIAETPQIAPAIAVIPPARQVATRLERYSSRSMAQVGGIRS
jgi:hypothetical protein